MVVLGDKTYVITDDGSDPFLFSVSGSTAETVPTAPDSGGAPNGTFLDESLAPDGSTWVLTTGGVYRLTLDKASVRVFPRVKLAGFDARTVTARGYANRSDVALVASGNDLRWVSPADELLHTKGGIAWLVSPDVARQPVSPTVVAGSHVVFMDKNTAFLYPEPDTIGAYLVQSGTYPSVSATGAALVASSNDGKTVALWAKSSTTVRVVSVDAFLPASPVHLEKGSAVWITGKPGGGFTALTVSQDGRYFIETVPSN
jgi:hypothetical protein